MAKSAFLTESKDATRFMGHRKRTQGFSDIGTKGKPSSSAAMTEEEKQVFKSLQISHDTRYDAMDYYRVHGGTASSTGHFARICQINRRMHGLPEVKKTLGDGASLQDLVELELEEPVNDWERVAYTPAASVAERIEWQESFDKEVKRLFVDFELTDQPACRLNHLDRMHSWFTEHGAKQARKVVKGPNFLVMDRKGRLPPGSTKNIPTKLSNTTQVLASEFTSPYNTASGNAKFGKPRVR
mmetsp:Transcript_38448/g.86681  ORF Transcript_38448/g.86681 Transcript_38448/m.86681 type:complete len:241 (-) Transcript_38448:197-919(-)